MKFPWPSKSQDEKEIKKIWDDCRNAALIIGEGTKEVDLFLRAWGISPPSDPGQLLSVRSHAFSVLMNATESFSIPMLSQERLDSLLNLLTPDGIDLTRDCPVCLTRFEDSGKLKLHRSAGYRN
jgi:hypothetical protein